MSAIYSSISSFTWWTLQLAEYIWLESQRQTHLGSQFWEKYIYSGYFPLGNAPLVGDKLKSLVRLGAIYAQAFNILAEMLSTRLSVNTSQGKGELLNDYFVGCFNRRCPPLRATHSPTYHLSNTELQEFPEEFLCT